MCSPIPAKQGQSCWIPLMHQRVHYRCRYLVTLKSMQFHTLFTLLPEYFSTFPHGTCLLTVSCIIFSLRGSLSPIFRLHYQAILLANPVPYRTEWNANGSNTLYGFTSECLCRQFHASLSKELSSHPTTPNREAQIQDGLFSFPSQVLGESLLISFPPLINMLKSRGYPLTLEASLIKNGLT